MSTLVVAAAVVVSLSSHIAAADTVTVSGRVESGGAAISGAKVTLLRAGNVIGAPAVPIGSDVSDAGGNFSIARSASNATDVIYLVAEGGAWSGAAGNAALKLAAIPGASPSAASMTIVNERTTVAFAYAFAQFAAGTNVAGPAPGLPNAAATAGNLADVATGNVAAVLAQRPNGAATSTRAEFNSLSNLLASCVEASSKTACDDLFLFTSVAGRPAPTDTLAAAESIATHPANNVQALFGLSSLTRVYQPALTRTEGPDAWTVAVAYQGNGHEFDAPGNMAVDAYGNIWITNNYVFDRNPRKPTCGGKQLLELTPTGLDAPGAPFSGGGVYGEGFGVVIDHAGAVWTGNFGFVGQGCTNPREGRSISKFTASGVPLSPDGIGFPQGGVSGPQGMAIDQRGNIWIANDTADQNGQYSITIYPHGDPNSAIRRADPILNQPFGVAIDGNGYAWVTNRGNNTVAVFAPDFTLARTFGEAGTPSSGTISRPLGIAIDSKGNAWVSNQGSYSVAMIEPLGKVTDFTGGGLTGPWGIAVDGADNVFVSNFGGMHFLGAVVTELCGSNTGACGPGVRRGDPISPPTGFTSGAFTRLTGITIDPSGNVWVPDNWMKHQLPTNPGGHAMVELIGLAAPVKTPMFGPPQQP